MHSSQNGRDASTAQVPRFITQAIATLLLAAPGLFLLVFALHFRDLSKFLDFKWSTTPEWPTAEQYVKALIAAGNRWPMVHDPHILGYLTLPLSLFAAVGLYLIGRETRPVASALSLFVTVSGFIFMGGLFGAWAVIFRAFGDIDGRYTEGAVAAWTALTSPRGAMLLTTWLAKLAMVGQVLQVLCLVGQRPLPVWAPIVAAAGFTLILIFWDIDNWMFLGQLLIFIAMFPMRRRLLDLGRVANTTAPPLPA